MTNNTEQQAVPVAQEAMYLIRKNGMFYRPNAQGYTCDTAQAGRFTLSEAIRHSHPNGPDGPRDGIDYIPTYEPAALPLPCKSGEGADTLDARAEGRKILEAVATGARSHEYERAAFRLIRQMDGAWYDPKEYGDDWLKVLAALTPDATQTREAEGAEPDWAAIRAAVAKAAWPSTGLVDEAMATIRAALNARGGA